MSTIQSRLTASLANPPRPVNAPSAWIPVQTGRPPEGQIVMLLRTQGCPVAAYLDDSEDWCGAETEQPLTDEYKPVAWLPIAPVPLEIAGRCGSSLQASARRQHFIVNRMHLAAGRPPVPCAVPPLSREEYEAMCRNVFSLPPDAL